MATENNNISCFMIGSAANRSVQYQSNIIQGITDSSIISEKFRFREPLYYDGFDVFYTFKNLSTAPHGIIPDKYPVDFNHNLDFIAIDQSTHVHSTVSAPDTSPLLHTDIYRDNVTDRKHGSNLDTIAGRRHGTNLYEVSQTDVRYPYGYMKVLSPFNSSVTSFTLYGHIKNNIYFDSMLLYCGSENHIEFALGSSYANDITTYSIYVNDIYEIPYYIVYSIVNTEPVDRFFLTYDDASGFNMLFSPLISSDAITKQLYPSTLTFVTVVDRKRYINDADDSYLYFLKDYDNSRYTTINNSFYELGFKYGTSTDGTITTAEVLNFWNKSGNKAHPVLSKTGDYSLDSTYVYNDIVFGSGSITNIPKHHFDLGRFDISKSTLYQHLDLNIYPSSTRLKMCIDHNTDHSGVTIRPTVNFYNIGGIVASWSGVSFLPSGNKQEITIYPNYFGYNTQADLDYNIAQYGSNQLLIDQMDYIGSYCEFEYDDKQGNDFYSDLKVYTYYLESDGWAFAPSGLSSYISLYINHGTSNNNIDLYSYGHDISNSGISLSVSGASAPVASTSGFLCFPLYITTNIPVGSSGDATLYVWGTTNPTLRKELTLYLRNTTPDPAYSMNLYTTGPPHGSISGIMPLFVGGCGTTISDVITLYTSAPSGINDNIPLYINAPGGASGYYPYNDHMNLFIERIEGVERRMDLYLQNIGNSSGNIPLSIHGNTPIASGIDLFTSGKNAPVTKSTSLFSHGF